LRTKRYNVLTVAPNSPLPLRNKSSMLVGDILMSPSVALLAVRQSGPSTTTPEAPGLAARCMPRYVVSVARNVKCPLSLEKAGQYIVVNATARIGQAVDSNSL
jgi:hypothetical protein